MNCIKKSFKNNKKYLKLIFLLMCLGLIIGFLLTRKIINQDLLDQIQNIEDYLNINKINFLISHTTTICILFIASLTIIGLILFPINIIYEGICISFNIFTFTKIFKLNGFIYSIIYNLFTKGIYLILLIIVFRKLISILKTILSKKEKNEKKTIIIKKIKQIGMYSSFIILNDILIYLFANKILQLFLFIIK